MEAQNSNPIIEFQHDGQAAIVNYSVPLPGSHTGRRIILLEDVIWKNSKRRSIRTYYWRESGTRSRNTSSTWNYDR